MVPQGRRPGSHRSTVYAGQTDLAPGRIRDPDYAAKHLKDQKTLFLADGDVLITPQKKLVLLFEKINKKLPWIKRIRLYANCKSIRAKSVEDLADLKRLGLDRIYLGLESGHDEILTSIVKGSNPKQMVEAGLKVKEAKLFLSVTVLLGIAGPDKSLLHAKETAKVLNEMAPKQIAALTLMLIPGTPLFKEMAAGKFKLPSQLDLLKELRCLLKHLTVDKVMFQANHASNYLPIDCRLQKDKQKVLQSIDLAIDGELPLMPEYMRGL